MNARPAGALDSPPHPTRESLSFLLDRADAFRVDIFSSPPSEVHAPHGTGQADFPHKMLSTTFYE